MIGNTDILNLFKNWVNSHSIPKFIIMYGEKGCGKRTLARELSKIAKMQYVEVGSSIKEIRDSLDIIRSNSHALLVYDADEMSLQAKQVILKTVEEEVNNAVVVMVASNDKNIPSTLMNRAFYLMVPWNTINELEEAFEKFVDSTDSRLVDYCGTIGQMIDIANGDETAFFDFADLLVNRISTVSPMNAMKAAERIIKEFDALTLLYVVREMFLEQFRTAIGENTSAQCYLATSDTLDKLSRSGSNKQEVIDAWVFKIREIMGVNENA